MNPVWAKVRSNKRITYVIAALLLVAVFLSFFLFLFVQFQTATLQSLSQVSGNFAERVNIITDALTENIKTSAMQMFYTSTIKNLRTKSELTKSERIIAHRDLGNFVSSSDFLGSVMVYNNKLDMVFTSEGGHASQKSGEFHDRSAVELLTHPKDFPFLSPIKRERGSVDCYSFLFFEEDGDGSNAMLINVDAKWYESQLLGLSNPDNYIILDDTGNPIVFDLTELAQQVSAIWPKIEQQLAENPTKGFISPSIFSNSPGWLYFYLEKTHWYYLKPLDFEELAPGLMHIRNYLFMSLGVVGSITTLMFIYLILKVYLPFRRIQAALRSTGRDTASVSLQVNRLVESHRQSSSLQQIKKLRLGEAPAGFLFPAMAVMSHGGAPEAMLTAVNADHPTAIGISEGLVCTAVISPCTDEDCQNFADNIPPTCYGTLYISKVCDTAEQLHASFTALDELKNLRFLYEGQTIFRESMLLECNATSGLQSKEVSGLISALKAGQTDAARAKWQSIFEAIRKNRYSDFCFALRYIGKSLSVLRHEFGLDGSVQIDALINDGLENVQQLHSYIDGQLAELGAIIGRYRHEQLINLSDKIEHYIGAHYTEEALSVQQIADYFEVNAAYLNRQYRQAVDGSISDMIHRVRVTEACRLLKSTNESAEFIAQCVGYSNIKYFFVLFKKLTGVTPKQFRISGRLPTAAEQTL